MSTVHKQNIALIGAGNVATHLAKALTEAGHNIVAVVSRGYSSACELARSVGAKPFRTSAEIPESCDIAIICTNDAAVVQAAAALPRKSMIVAHTSGSVPLEKIAALHPHAGVIYPLQTFSKDSPVDMRRVPFFIEATDKETCDVLTRLARDISDNVRPADSDTRKTLHVAGVLASNFPIYLLELCGNVLSEAGLPLTTIEPLIEASVAKAMKMGALEALTGPARRGDTATVKAHLDYLKDNPDAAEVYRLLSEKILKQYHPESNID